MNKDKLLKLKSNKDVKTLTSNFAYLTILQIAGYVFPLITLPYLARVLGVSKFGEIAFAASVIVYFQTIVDWGFMFTATRDVARVRNDLHKVSQIFSNVFWSKIFLMLASASILIILITTVPIFKDSYKLLIFTFLLIPGHIMFPDWLFQGLERMKYTTILNLLSKAFFTLAVFIFIKEESDYLYQPLLISMGFFFSGFISMYIIIFKWKIRLLKPDVEQIKKHIKSSTNIFINQLMPNLYNSFSVMLLGLCGGSVANGKLDAGSKFAQIASQFLGIISRTFYPFLSRKIDAHDLFAKLNIILSILVTLILYFMSPILIKIFYTPEFIDSVLVLKIMSISLVFLVLNSVYGTNYLILKGREKELRNLTIISSFIGFFAAFPMVYYFSFLGAAITITFTRGLLGIGSWWLSKKY